MADAPLFKSVFGEDWQRLPPVMHKHYDVRAGSADKVTVEGLMTVERSLLAKLLSPLLRFCGALVPYSGSAIPVTVHFTSPPGTKIFRFDRLFHLPGRTYNFRSNMEHLRGNEMVEFMRFGIGWHSRFIWDGQKVRLQHKGYVWRIFGLLISLPLTLVIGKGEAWEEALSDESFQMWMGVTHPLFGQIYSYSGQFRVTEMQHG